MAMMSIGKAWEESVAFVARERSLLFPVALLFIALPGLILQEMTPPELAGWAMTKNALPNVPNSFWLAMLIGIIVIWFGSLTLFALALRPGISVGEALRLGLARLPVLLGTALLVAGVLMGAMVVVSIFVVALTLVAKPVGAALGMVGAIGVGALMVYASVRLLLLNPVVIDGSQGVVPSLRYSWALTRGHFWRLFGFILVLTLLSAIVGAAAQSVFGVIGRLVGGVDGARLTGGVASAAVSTVVQVYMLVMLARLYRHAEAG
ncbi:MAG TPA: glycerophosphoryl diester phosphodiesterase membrane domain-containing protein [Sphingobium sp.]|nr:glycerophosphoryl diester phosphodiesterase membrane domain-containing protein [Sphingobium sp.]